MPLPEMFNRRGVSRKIRIDHQLDQIGFRQARNFQQVLEKTDLDWMISVDGYRESDNAACFSEDVMTAVHPKNFPAVAP